MRYSNSHVLHVVREAVKFSAGVAALFLIAACCLFHWAYSRGAFGTAPVERPIRLENGSSVNVHFSVPNRGDHDIEIWYPRNASDDVNKDLWRIFGKVTLRINAGSLGELPVAEIELPVKDNKSDRDGAAMVVFTKAMDPRNDYSLALQIDRIPPGLARSQAVVKVELVSDYALIFMRVELVALAFLVLASLCVFLSIRWWRAARAAGDQNGVQKVSAEENGVVS